MKLSSWPEIGSDGDVLLTPYVPKGITGYDGDDDDDVGLLVRRTLLNSLETCKACYALGIFVNIFEVENVLWTEVTWKV